MKTNPTRSRAATPAGFPRLRVLWLDQGCSVAGFRQGVDGYTNAFDTNLRHATPDVNYAADATLWSDANNSGNTNTTECLLRFDNVIGTGTNQVPPGSLIHAAVYTNATCYARGVYDSDGRVVELGTKENPNPDYRPALVIWADASAREPASPPRAGGTGLDRR